MTNLPKIGAHTVTRSHIAIYSYFPSEQRRVSDVKIEWSDERGNATKVGASSTKKRNIKYIKFNYHAAIYPIVFDIVSFSLSMDLGGPAQLTLMHFIFIYPKRENATKTASQLAMLPLFLPLLRSVDFYVLFSMFFIIISRCVSLCRSLMYSTT